MINDSSKTLTVTRNIPLDHPSLPGHFPGQPIVPGVVLLEQVIDAIRQAYPDVEISGFSAVKFISVLLPGQTFDIRLDVPANHKLKFTCVVQDTQIASGQALLAPKIINGQLNENKPEKSERG